MTDDKLTAIAAEVHEIATSVKRLHERQSASDVRIENLHREHMQLKDRVEGVSAEVRLIQQAANMQQSANQQTHAAMAQATADLSAKLDKITHGLFVSAATIILALAVLLYQTLFAGYVG